MLTGAVVKSRIAREYKYLKADAESAPRALRARVRAARDAVTPSRRAGVAVLAGVAIVVWGLAQWAPVVATVVAGLSLTAYGFLFVNVDEEQRATRRGRR